MSGPEQHYGGMTVNERLLVAGLIQEFDVAIDSEDRERAVQILLRVSLSDASAGETVDATLADPAKYGYPCSI